MRLLVIVPTYNERKNVAPLAERLMQLPLDLEVLYVDDNSPDGTGSVLDEMASRNERIHILHRQSKEGIGAAHLAGLKWALDRGYRVLATMDCDMTHAPEDLPAFLAASEKYDVVVGSRYMQPGSLRGWNWRRKALTRLAHFLTRSLLGLPYDCTGAYRIYRMDRISDGYFNLVRSMSYSFFFESLFIFHQNAISIGQVPISLPPRTYGSSKMSITEPFKGISHLLHLAIARLTSPEVFLLPKKEPVWDSQLKDPQGWDAYWEQNSSNSGSFVYQIIATIYRQLVIANRLTEAVRSTFAPGARLLHGGCGSGQVDRAIQKEVKLTAVDISVGALKRYSQTVEHVDEIRHASIFALPFGDRSFDGVYNLGVMEHFTQPQIVAILKEFRRVLKPSGKLLLFWPHAKASSVAVLKGWHLLRKSKPALHPPEISLVESRAWVEACLHEGGFQLDSYSFGWRDFFVQAVITASPLSAPATSNQPEPSPISSR